MSHRRKSDHSSAASDCKRENEQVKSEAINNNRNQKFN